MKKLLLLGLLILFIGCPTTEINSARIYIERGEYQRAKEQILIGLKNDPSNYELYCLLAKAEIGLLHWIEVSAAFRDAIKADSLSAVKWILKDTKNIGVYWQAFYNSAVALEMEKKYEAALADLELCELIDPSKVNVYILRGGIYAALGKKENASNAYAKALSLDPENPQVYYLVGKAFFDKKEYDSALVKFDDAIKYYDKKYKAVARVVFQNLPEVDKLLAQKIVNLWVAKNNDELDQLIKVKLGFDGGLAAYQKNIDSFYKTTLGLAMAYYLGGISQYNLKNNDAALSYIMKSLDLMPDDVDALFYAGELQVRANKFQEALAYFERVTKIKEDALYSWFYIAVIKMQLKDYKKAIDILEGKVLVLNPKFVDALNNLAFCYRELGNTKKALEYLQKAEKIQKEQ
jgi:tetratricopeptide (TPR) repeat protein